MATYQVTYWQEIPSQVDARDGAGKAAKRMLSHRFQVLIDVVATKRNLESSDDYINQWSKGPKLEREGPAQEVLDAIVSELEAQYPAIRAAAMDEAAPAKT